MSKRRDIEAHVRTLDEIEGIMGVMKNLALMESHKLSRVLAAQHRVVENIEAAGQDFLAFHPTLAPDLSGKELYLVIGTERGFCGDFNDRLLSALDGHLRTTGERDPVLILVGHKLVERAGLVHRFAATVEGPTVTEEVQPVLTRVIDQLREAAARRASGGRAPVTAVYHDAVTESVVVRPLRPFPSPPRAAHRNPFPPLLTLPPPVFFSQLVDLYLFSLLHAIFFSALMAESRARLAHLESAIQRLERDETDLLRRRNILRQEEITEEIQMLMLGTLVTRPHR
ncbi:MAG TPA: FoF1 ATP synthase subunit gamma [Nitrospira sp.]|nr:FoF1 ATP synthase subunit gamma [Nitrospira sp.]